MLFRWTHIEGVSVLRVLCCVKKMNGRRAFICLQCHVFSISVRPIWFSLPKPYGLIKIPYLPFASNSDGNLSGLMAPDFSAASGGAIYLPEKTVSHEDFAFLHDSILAHGTKCGPSGSFSDDAVLISSKIRLKGNDFGNESKVFLRCFRDKLNDSLVIDVLNLLRNRELQVKFFIWAGNQIGYRHSGATYHALLETIGVNKHTKLPDHVLQEIKNDDYEMLGSLLNVLVRRCCNNGLFSEALEELGRLKDSGCRPSKATYNALIQALSRAGRLESAFLVHSEMSDLGLNMDSCALGCYARSLCKAGKWKEALSIIESEEYLPDTVLYTEMISGLCDASLFDEAMNFVNRMRSNSCHPNVVTYTVLLNGFLEKKQLRRCKKIIHMMLTEGCSPSLSMFNSLIHGFCGLGEYRYAYKLLKKMVECGRPRYVAYNIIIGGICGKEKFPSIEFMELAEKAYQEMLEDGIILNKINVVNFVHCFCGVGKFEKAFSVIREMMTNGFIPDTSTYSKVIEYLCHAHQVEKAFFLFAEMKKNGVVPDVFTYTILIDSFCKVGLIQQARNWFTEMASDGCAPNVVTYTALIHGCLKAGLLSEANKLFGSMLTSGCSPNVITYSALIDGLCKVGHADKACMVYSRMRGTMSLRDVDIYFQHGASSLVSPNSYTYGALVDGLCKVHKVTEAHNLLEAMENAGSAPNPVVYDALIDGFCKVGKLDEAQKIFAQMSERGCHPTIYTYSTLIDRLFKDKRLDLALKVLSKMLDSACVPNVVTYTEMIDGFCKLGKFEEAYKLLGMMEEKGCSPNVVTYTALISGLGKFGKFEASLDMLKEMKEKGIAPNFVTYRVLINHCCTAGLLDEACSLLQEMKQTYWPVHAKTYCTVIHGFSKEFITSVGLMEEVSEYKSVPLVPAYLMLIDSFRRAGRLDKALELLEEVLATVTCSSFAAHKVYASLVECFCLAGNIEKAFKLYQDMVKRELVPEIGVLIHLIKGLAKGNKWEEAFLLSDCIYRMSITWIC